METAGEERDETVVTRFKPGRSVVMECRRKKNPLQSIFRETSPVLFPWWG